MSEESFFRSGLLLIREVLRWSWRRGPVAERIEPVCRSQLTQQPNELVQCSHVSHVVWFGGATVLVQLGRRRVLIDPVVPSRTWWLPGECGRNGHAAWKNLDPIDVIVVTHRGELDSRALHGVSRRTPVVVPSGLGADLCRQGFNQVVELAAGEQYADRDLDVTALRSGRGPDRLTWGGQGAAWRGVSVSVSGNRNEPDRGRRFLYLRHCESGEPSDSTDGLADGVPSCPPDLVVVSVSDEKAGWLTRRQGFPPEMALETFRTVEGRALMPIPTASAQEPARLDAAIARIRARWDDLPPMGATLLIPRIGEVVNVPDL